MWVLIKTLFTPRTTPDPPWLQPGEVERAIERAIDHTDPRLRLVGGYRRKLRPVVVQALDYTRGLIAHIPGPVDLERRAFGRDPRVQGYFASPDHLHEVLRDDRALGGFLTDPAHGSADSCYALLVMEKEEKRTLGYAHDGHMLRGDVLQTVVNFTGHRFVKPAASPEAVRAELRERAFQHLVSAAVRRVADIREQRADLERRRIHLEMELRAQRARAGAMDALLDGDGAAAGHHAVLSRELAETTALLAQAARRLETLDDYLDLLQEVFSGAPDHCGLAEDSICINRMGVKDGRDGDRPCEQVPYADIRIGDRNRVGVLVRLPREEIQNARASRCDWDQAVR